MLKWLGHWESGESKRRRDSHNLTNKQYFFKYLPVHICGIESVVDSSGISE